MSGYIGTKSVLLSTTAATVTGNATIGGNLTVDTNTLFVDSTNNRVGIGTSSPSYSLEVNEDGEGFIMVRGSDTGNTGIIFGDQSDAAQSSISQNNTDNSLRFNGYNNEERMRLDSSGNLLVGTTDTDPSNDTSGTGGIALGASSYISMARANATPLLVNRIGTDGENILIKKNGTTVGGIGSDAANLYIGNTDTNLRFVDGTPKRVLPAAASGASSDGLIDFGNSSNRFKDLYLSGGVYLGGTTSANHLDDVEFGTWTPTISSGTMGSSDSTYTKIGDTVIARAFVVNFSDTSSSSTINIGGLPFASNGYIMGGAHMYRYIAPANGGDSIAVYGGNNATAISLYACASGGAAYEQLTHQRFTAGNANFFLVITYKTLA